MDPYGCVGPLDFTVNAPAFVHVCVYRSARCLLQYRLQSAVKLRNPSSSTDYFITFLF